MRTEKLSRLLIFGNNKDKGEIISRLQHLGVMHIKKAEIKEGLVQDTPMSKVDLMSSQLLKLQFISNQTGVDSSFYLEGLPPLSKVLDQAEEFIERHLGDVEKLVGQRKAIEQKINKLKAEEHVLKGIPFPLKGEVPDSDKRIIVNSLEDISKHPFPVKVKLQKHYKKGKEYFTEFFMKNSDVAKFQRSLREINGKQIHLPTMEKGSSEHLQKIKREVNELQSKSDEIEKSLFRKINGKQSKIKFLITSLENYREQANISQNFLRSSSFFAIEGYVKKEDVVRVKNSFPELTIYAHEAETDAPSKLKNKFLAKYFEPITTMFGIPSYSLVDPTPLVTIFFPLFFGFMLSDVGYGLLLLIAILALYFHLGDGFRTPTIVFGISAISSIIFGLLFGSFFGNLVTITPLYADSFSASFVILQISLLIGLVHINLGVALQAYQQVLKKSNLWDFVKAVLPIPLIEVAIVLIYFGQYYLAALSAIAAISILIADKGIFGIMDVSGFFGVWFSYARLLALSLATAGVALAINIVAEKTLAFGKIGFFFWIIVIVFGHLFNFGLNILGCSIHSARLHYVEFFSLFFEAEGYPFKEFKVKKTMDFDKE